MEVLSIWKTKSIRLLANSIMTETQTLGELPIKLWLHMKEQESGIFYEAPNMKN